MVLTAAYAVQQLVPYFGRTTSIYNLEARRLTQQCCEEVWLFTRYFQLLLHLLKIQMFPRSNLILKIYILHFQYPSFISLFRSFTLLYLYTFYFSIFTVEHICLKYKIYSTSVPSTKISSTMAYIKVRLVQTPSFICIDGSQGLAN